MKAKYAQKITRKYIALMAGISLTGMVLGIVQLILSMNTVMAVFSLVYPGIYCWIFMSQPLVHINERDKLVTGGPAFGGFAIDIHQIISLEEGRKQGIKVRYLFQGQERNLGTIGISDKDKPRLVADLLSINPGIEIKIEN